MPVDFLPLILGAAFIGTLIVTAVVALLRKRKKQTWFIGILVASSFPAIYVWLYHRTEIRYSRSAAQGDVEAMYRLGRSYMSYKRGSPYNPPKGRELLCQAAENGYVPAQMALGAYYLSGVSTPHDQAEALRWFRRAAEQSDEEAKEVIEDVTQNGFDVGHPKGIAWRIVTKWIYD